VSVPVDDPTVEVDDVSTGLHAGGPLRDLELSSPRPGEVVRGYLLPLRGTVTARADAPAIRVFSAIGDDRVTSGVAYPGDVAYEFSFLVGCAAQPREFDLELFAVLQDGTSIRLAGIRGRRSPLRSSFAPSVQPLLVTTIGRSGSSVLIQALEGHPEIAAYHPFAADPRPSAYWASVFRDLSDPASSLHQLARGQVPASTERGWWLGMQLPQESFGDDPLERWMGVDHVLSLAAYCQGRIESLYAKIGAEAGLAPRYFAEKARPDRITATVCELYPDSRELILVRDWRDVFCSMRSYSTKRGIPLFGRSDQGTDAEHVTFLRARVEELMRHLEANGDRTHVVRYEDLVLDPAATIERILEYLGLERTPDVVAAMREPVLDSGPEGETHRTTAGGDQSIGRWREDLSAELRATCDEELGPLLAQLGYESG
jgi:hypothetical protein